MALLSDGASLSECLLQCSICQDTLSDPRTLPCFHSYCKSCLETFVKIKRDKAVDKTIEVFKCPTCDTGFALNSNEEVAGMPTTHFISNMLNVVAIQQRTKQVDCTSCETEEASGHCVTCQLFMCNTCLETHQNWPAFKKHTLLSIDEFIESSTENLGMFRHRVKCKKHASKALKFFCEECEELICRYCMDFEHLKQNHSCHLAEVAAEKKRQELRVCCDILEGKLNEESEALQEGSNIAQCLKENFAKAKEGINQHKRIVQETFLRKLNEKAQEMTEELECEYKRTLDSIAQDRSAVTSYLHKVKVSVELSKSILDKGSQEDVMSSKELIAHMKKLKKEGQLPNSLELTRRVCYIGYKGREIDGDLTAILSEKLGRVVVPSVLENASLILRHEEDCAYQMEVWFNSVCQWRLCYRATRDGWRASDFHRCCNNKQPTVTLVKVGEYIFGGYSDRAWAGSSFKQSKSSLIFSLRNKDNLPPFIAPVYRNSAWAVYRSVTCGPTFGCDKLTNGSCNSHDLFICDNPHSSLQSHTDLGATYKPPIAYSYGEEQTRSLLAGSYNFTPTEIEVFY